MKGSFMKKFISNSFFFILLLLLFTSLLFAQKAAIKVEAMDGHKLTLLGLSNPNGWDNVSTGLNTVGVGTMVWMTGWDTSGYTTYKPALTYLWELTAVPGGSLTVLETTTDQLSNFRPDVAGTYTVQLTITTVAGSHSTSLTITAANYTGTNWKSVAGAAFNCASCHEAATPTIYTNWKSSGHANMFKNGMDGLNGSYWGESCFQCHTTGYNKNATAVNGGFDDVATTVGFVADDWKPWRIGLFDSLLTTDKKLLSLVGGITCENCHGPKNPTHFGTGTQPKTMDAGVCGQCHNEPWRHNKYAQWENSGHSEAVWSSSFRTTGTPVGTNYNLNACVRCHDGQAFINFTKGKSFDNSAAAGYGQIKQTMITCQTCHEPHSTSLRTGPAGSDTLATGYNYSSFNFGSGKTCVNCHKYRRGENRYITQTAMSSTWGPHYAGATDIFLGQNGHTFGATLPSSIAHQNVENSCVGCHMSATPDTGTAARDKIGQHSWTMSYTDPNTSITYNNVTGCNACHAGITKFDQIKASYDYDKNGTLEAFITEVEGLKKKLAKMLPPIGLDSVNRDMVKLSPDSTLYKKAFWNYLYVKYDGSHGVHNPKYVVSLLQTGIDAIFYSRLAGQIGSITDVPNDQGKQIQIAWYKFPGETEPLNPIRNYGIWREDEAKIGKVVAIDSWKDVEKYLPTIVKGNQFSIAGTVWTFVGWSPIAGTELYSVNVPTLFDSTVSAGMAWTKFKVTAHDTNNVIVAESRVDSGYSADNLIPTAPSGLAASIVVPAIRLQWDTPTDSDLNYYAIYRGTTPGFDFESTPPIGTTTDNFFIDNDVVEASHYYYVVRGFDFSGNKGQTSGTDILFLDVDDPNGMPTEFSLKQNYPNPFNPSTSIKYQVSQAGNVTITVYNSIGQEVLTLVNRQHEVGYYSISWNGKDKSGISVNSGIYLYKMKSESYTSVKKMILVK